MPRCHPILLAGVLSACTATSSGAPPAPGSPVQVSGASGGIVRARIHNDQTASTRFIAAPIADVWAALPSAYQAMGIPTPGADSSAKAFGNLGFRTQRLGGRSLSTYLDCGAGITAVPRADEYDITMSVRTDLASTTDGTLLTTTVQGSGVPRAVSGNAVFCRSLGTLEAAMFERVLEAVSGDR